MSTTSAPAKAEQQAAEQEAHRKKVVQRIIRRRKAGAGYPTIARELNDANVPTLGKGKLWYAPVVRAICIRELGGAEQSMKAAGTSRPGSGGKKASANAAASNGKNASASRPARPDPKPSARKGRRSSRPQPSAMPD